MMKIQFCSNDQKIYFTTDDLPMLISGPEGSGASFFSVSLVSYLYLRGQKILFFTQKHMGKDQFLEQIDSDDFIEILSEKDLLQIEDQQAVIIRSGDKNLFKKALQTIGDIDSIIIFVKNIEDTLDHDTLSMLADKQKVILSGTLTHSNLEEDIENRNYNSRILFSPDRSAIMETPAGSRSITITVG